MDIYKYLQKDHKKVDDLFTQLLKTKEKEKREALFEKIKYELLLHAKTEEATFYKALESKKATKEEIGHANEEHDEIEKYIKKLSKLPIESDEWMEQLGEFKHAVSHHVKEEEGTIFDDAKKILSDKQATELAEEMAEMKKETPINL